MSLELKYFEELKKHKQELEQNVEKYLNKIREIARKYNLEVYLTGSRAGGNYLEGSDYDIVVLIPDKKWGEWLKIKRELKLAVNENPYIEFHIYRKSWKSIIKLFYKTLRKL